MLGLSDSMDFTGAFGTSPALQIADAFHDDAEPMSSVEQGELPLESSQESTLEVEVGGDIVRHKDRSKKVKGGRVKVDRGTDTGEQGCTVIASFGKHRKGRAKIVKETVTIETQYPEMNHMGTSSFTDELMVSGVGGGYGMGYDGDTSELEAVVTGKDFSEEKNVVESYSDNELIFSPVEEQTLENDIRAICDAIELNKAKTILQEDLRSSIEPCFHHVDINKNQVQTPSVLKNSIELDCVRNNNIICDKIKVFKTEPEISQNLVSRAVIGQKDVSESVIGQKDILRSVIGQKGILGSGVGQALNVPQDEEWLLAAVWEAERNLLDIYGLKAPERVSSGYLV